MVLRDKVKDLPAMIGAAIGCGAGAYLAFHDLKSFVWLPVAAAAYWLITVNVRAFKPEWSNAFRSILQASAVKPTLAAQWYVGMRFFVLGSILGATVVGAGGKTMNILFYSLPGQYVNWIAALVVPVGYTAYLFKRGNQRLYGIVEVLVGVAGAIGVTTKQQFGPAQGLAMIGSIYVVARGFNNISDAGNPNTASETAPSGVQELS